MRKPLSPIAHAEWGLFWLRAARAIYSTDHHRASCHFNSYDHALHIMALEAIS